MSYYTEDVTRRRVVRTAEGGWNHEFGPAVRVDEEALMDAHEDHDEDEAGNCIDGCDPVIDAEDIQPGIRIRLQDGTVAKVWGVSHHDSGPVVMSLTVTTGWDEPARVIEADYAMRFPVVAR